MKPLLLATTLCLMTGCSALPPATEPATQRLSAQDDQVRIDEWRVRGQTQRLTVQPKQVGRAYDIVPAPGGQDPTQGKSTTGQRVWPVLSF
jgi:starvation-inducible outer membrane lipoprotein